MEGLMQVVIHVVDCNEVGGRLQILWLNQEELHMHITLSFMVQGILTQRNFTDMSRTCMQRLHPKPHDHEWLTLSRVSMVSEPLRSEVRYQHLACQFEQS